MPETIHCRVRGCGKAIRVKNFGDQQAKLRRHRQKSHPRLFKQSIRKGVETRKRNRS